MRRMRQERLGVIPSRMFSVTGGVMSLPSRTMERPIDRTELYLSDEAAGLGLRRELSRTAQREQVRSHPAVYVKHPEPVEGCGSCKVAPFDELRMLL